MFRSIRLVPLLLMMGVGCTDDPTTTDSGQVEVDCTPSGVICTVSGTGIAGSNDKEDLATLDDFIVSDWNNHKIRHVQDGVVQTIIGTDFLGDGDPDFIEREAPGVHGTEVALNHPTSLEWNPATGKMLVPS